MLVSMNQTFLRVELRKGMKRFVAIESSDFLLLLRAKRQVSLFFKLWFLGKKGRRRQNYVIYSLIIFNGDIILGYLLISLS